MIAAAMPTMRPRNLSAERTIARIMMPRVRD
jgi:hypothetical protein